MGLLLFGLAIFFFAFGLLPYWFKVHKHLSEILGCQHPISFSSRDLRFCNLDVGWALTFPNVGWISSLRVLGDTLQIPGFYVLHTIMAVLMCMVWAVLFGLTVFAFWKGKIFFADEADVLKDEYRKADNGIV
jgi:tellurite resistance protein TehA-like permease